MGRHRDPARPDRETLAELCKTKNPTQIAAIYGKDVKTVYKWLNSESLKAQPNPNMHRPHIHVDMDEVVKMADAGYSKSEIAQKFGVTYDLISRRLKAIGWKKPTYDIPDPKGVNCVRYPKYSRTCEYGAGDVCMYVCFGMGRRPCPANDCTVYKKRDGKKFEIKNGVGRWYD